MGPRVCYAAPKGNAITMRSAARFGLIAWLALLAGTTHAQSSALTPELSQRQFSLQMSRYEQMIGRLQQQQERLMADIRTLQRGFEATKKQAESADTTGQKLGDQWLKFQNEQDGITPWGSGQRDCPAIGAKHQELKMQLAPDGGEAVRYLCYDGKGLYLGSERYRLGAGLGADTSSK
jgi:hypothetical protein